MFLDVHSEITNRLACLVRELMTLPYLKIVFSVFAAFGVHLVEPFYCRTIEKGATHSTLKTFYKDLYTSMEIPVAINFFLFTHPSFKGVSQEMFQSVKKSYGTEVLLSVTIIAMGEEVEVPSAAEGGEVWSLQIS